MVTNKDFYNQMDEEDERQKVFETLKRGEKKCWAENKKLKANKNAQISEENPKKSKTSKKKSLTPDPVEV